MAERKGNPPIKRTITLEQLESYLGGLRPWGGQEVLKTVFDEMQVEEIRHICLGNITDRAWLTAKARAFFEMNDYPTVFMLLRELAILSGEPNCGEDFKKNVLQLIAEVARKCLGDFYYRGYLKDALVILCGKLYHDPKLYNEEIKKLFGDILKEYNGKDRYSACGETSRILTRIFLILSKLGDKSFLPQLRECLPDAKYLVHLMGYSDTCKDEVLMEGLRSLLIRHLENLPE